MSKNTLYFLSVLLNSVVPVWHLKSLDGSEDSHNASFSLGLLASYTLQMFTGVYRVIYDFYKIFLQSVNITGFSLQILQKKPLITL